MKNTSTICLLMVLMFSISCNKAPTTGKYSYFPSGIIVKDYIRDRCKVLDDSCKLFWYRQRIGINRDLSLKNAKESLREKLILLRYIKSPENFDKKSKEKLFYAYSLLTKKLVAYSGHDHLPSGLEMEKFLYSLALSISKGKVRGFNPIRLTKKESTELEVRKSFLKKNELSRYKKLYKALYKKKVNDTPTFSMFLKERLINEIRKNKKSK